MYLKYLWRVQFLSLFLIVKICGQTLNRAHKFTKE